MPKITYTGDKNPHYEQTPEEIEKADQRADLQRKYEDVYSSKYTSPEAYKYRIKKITKKLKEEYGS
jgi:hypothetical protein